jgi:hypothetical protein
MHSLSHSVEIYVYWEDRLQFGNNYYPRSARKAGFSETTDSRIAPLADIADKPDFWGTSMAAMNICRLLGSRLVPLILFIFLLSRIPAQQPQPARETTRGLVIDHPERLSGSWEVKGDHAIYGLHIQLATRVDGAPVTLIGVQQIFHSASIEVFERTGPTRRVETGTGFR